MHELRKLTTKEKALELNLNERIYGSFAEIGGGQEVASWFFRAGSASGTIAKTMSAYDMKFSDAIYGASTRYVSEERLITMLNKEYGLLEKRLTEKARLTRFFAFANTIETLNYDKSNQGHGWIGVRFQLTPMGEFNECIIHVRLNDSNALWQQEALGLIGVNLIYACFYTEDSEDLINSLVDNMDKDRVKIDMFRITGPNFRHVDNRLMSLLLVKNGMSKLAMFDQNGKVKQPSETLYKKNLLILRGRFRPVTYVNVDMLISGYRQFKNEPGVKTENIITLAELNIHDLISEGQTINLEEYLQTADLLNALGQNVIISSFKEYYRLVDYMAQFTRSSKIGIILGIYNLHNIFDESYYKDLYGRILEAFGLLFGKNIKIYVYPSKRRNSDEIYHLKDFEIPENQQPLLEYLIKNNKIAETKEPKLEHIHIISDHVLEMIKEGDSEWEKMVPSKVANMVKMKNLFNYKGNNQIA